MTKINDGGPAFPHSNPNYGGMSLRDAAALAALPAVINAFDPDMRHVGETAEQMFARLAFGVADAFIAAREKGDT